MSGPAGSRVAVLLALECFVDDLDLGHDEELDIEFHPIGAPVGAHHQRYFVGAVVWNTVIVAALLAVPPAAALARAHRAKDPLCPLPTAHQGAFRFPSFAYIPYQYLSQGTVLSASHLAFQPARGGPGTQGVGVLVLVAMAVVPVLVWRMLLRGDRFRATSATDSVLAEKGAKWGKARCVAYRLVYGSIIWSSTKGHFVERFGMVFEGYTPGKQWWMVPELLHLVTIAFFAAWRPGSQTACDVRNFTVAVILFAYLVGLLVYRPYLAPLTSGLQVLVAALNALAVALIAAGLSSGSPGPLRAGADALFAAAVFQFVLLLCDVSAYIIDICVGRRQQSWDPRARGVVPDGSSNNGGSGEDQRRVSFASVPPSEDSPPQSATPAALELFALGSVSSGLEQSDHPELPRTSTVAAITSPRLPPAGRSTSMMQDLTSPRDSSRGARPPRRRSRLSGGGSIGSADLAELRSISTRGPAAPAASVLRTASGPNPGSTAPRHLSMGQDDWARRRASRPQGTPVRSVRTRTMTAAGAPPRELRSVSGRGMGGTAPRSVRARGASAVSADSAVLSLLSVRGGAPGSAPGTPAGSAAATPAEAELSSATPVSPPADMFAVLGQGDSSSPLRNQIDLADCDTYRM